MNQTIYNYLKANKSRFSLDELEIALMKAGYTPLEIHEAMTKIYVEEQEILVEKILNREKEKFTWKSALPLIFLIISLFAVGMII